MVLYHPLFKPMSNESYRVKATTPGRLKDETILQHLYGEELVDFINIHTL